MKFFAEKLFNLYDIGDSKSSLFPLKKKILPFFKVRKTFFKPFLRIKRGLMLFRKSWYNTGGFLTFFHKNRIFFQFKLLMGLLKNRLRFRKKYFVDKKVKSLPSEFTFEFFEQTIFCNKNIFCCNFTNFFFVQKISSLNFQKNSSVQKKFKFLNFFLTQKIQEAILLSSFSKFKASFYIHLGMFPLSFLSYKERKLKHKSFFSSTLNIKTNLNLFFWKKTNKIFKKWVLKSFPKKSYFFQKCIDFFTRKAYRNFSKDNIEFLERFNDDLFLYELKNLGFSKVSQGLIKEKNWSFFFDKKLRSSFIRKSKIFLELIAFEKSKKYLFFSKKKTYLFHYFLGKKFLNILKDKFFLLPKKNKKKILHFLKKQGGLFWQRIIRRSFKQFNKKSKKSLGFYAKARVFVRKNKKANAQIVLRANDCLFFTNCIMKNGNKEKALRIFLKAFSLFSKEISDSLDYKKKKKKDPIFFLKKAINAVVPPLILVEKIIAGKRQKIPYIGNLQQRRKLAIRWIVSSARSSTLYKNKPFFYKLCYELLDILKKKGLSLKRKKEYVDEYSKGRYLIKNLNII